MAERTFEQWDAELPACMNVCRCCRKLDEAYAEAVNDWYGRGVVVRLGCLCEGSMAMDTGRETRTEFLPEAEAVKQWNEMNPL